jgi:capsular polysaccharide biosynthesis protein
MNRNRMIASHSFCRVLKEQITKLNSAVKINNTEEREDGNSQSDPPKLRNRIDSFAIDLIIIIAVLGLLTWFFY